MSDSGSKNDHPRSEAGGLLPLISRLKPPMRDADGPDEQWPLTSPYAFNGITATGQASIWYASPDKQLRRPMVFADGFGPPSPPPAQASPQGAQGASTPSPCPDLPLDYIRVSYTDGTTYIEANAGLILDCIKQILAKRVTQEPLIIGGGSMGGLVTRYALAYMETNNIPHETGKYFSVDTPHMGLILPAGVQYCLSYFAASNPGMAGAHNLFATPAGQEMQLFWLANYQQAMQVPSPLRLEFIENLKAVGDFPRKPWKIGLAAGAGNGQGNGIPGGALTVDWTAPDNSAAAQVYSSPGGGAQGLLFNGRTTGQSPVQIDSALASNAAFDSAPGGTFNFFQTLVSLFNSFGLEPNYQSCFVPTISALAMTGLDPYSQTDLFMDLTQGVPPKSALDIYKFSATNEPHATVEQEVNDWFCAQIAPPPAR